jgi:hypothetical protein
MLYKLIMIEPIFVNPDPCRRIRLDYLIDEISSLFRSAILNPSSPLKEVFAIVLNAK